MNSVEIQRYKSIYSRLVLLGAFFLIGGGLYTSKLFADISTQPPLLFKPQALSIEAAETLFTDAQNQDWVASRKYDGVRAVWNGRELLTKQGNHIYAPGTFIRQLPNFSLDGELWIATGKFHLTNQMVLSSLNGVPGHAELWDRAVYKVFEVPQEKGGLAQRLQKLHDYLLSHDVSQVQAVQQHALKSYPQLKAFYQAVLANGGEGVIVRDGLQPYLTGRLNSVIKIKPKIDAECVVSGYNLGKGRLQNLVGSIDCILLKQQKARLFPKLNPLQETTIRIGSGLKDIDRHHPPAIGSIVTFQYSGHTKTGLPRFAVYLRQRYTQQQAKKLGIELHK